MKNEIPFLDLSAQLPLIREEIMQRFEEIIDNTAFVANKNVESFESGMAAYAGAQHCIAVNNGTSALWAIVIGLGIGAGDEVILPVNTFIATAEAVSLVGATPVFVDMDPDTYLIDPSLIEAAITDKTKAIIPVHLYGHIADMDAIMEIAKQHDLLVIEDACQAHGAKYKGQLAGSIGDAAAFSCYPGKNLGAWGEAGAITTNNAELTDYLRKFISHGSAVKYVHDIVGSNVRMNEFQGAVLDVKLKYIEQWNEGRRTHAARYRELLADVDWIKLPVVMDESTPVWHLFVVQLLKGDRESFQAHMKAQDVNTGIHYPTPLHLTDAYADLPYAEGDFPAAEGAMNRIVSLPMFAELEDADIERVCEAIKSYNA